MSSGFVGQRPISTPADLHEEIEAEGRGEIVTLPLPWPSVHRVVGFGLRMGNISVLAGAPAASKSYMALNIALHAEKKGFRWVYQPMEDDAKRWVQKALAVHFTDWKLVGNPEEDTDEARRRLADYKKTRHASARDLESRLFECIRENPGVVALHSGSLDNDPAPYEGVLEWVMRICEEDRPDLLIIDPLSQIDFSGRDGDWKQQQRFMRLLTAIAQKNACHIMLVAHINKRPGRSAFLSTMDDLQGSAAFGRLAQYALLLDRHDEQESEVYSYWNTFTEHKLTLTIGKARDGFTGTRIAMDLMQDGPGFREHGIIRPGAKKGKGRPK